MTSEATTWMRQAVARTTNGLKMLLGRGRILLVKDDGPVQMLQVRVSAKELMDIARLSEFGFASRPPKNSDCAIVYISGERTWGIVVATGNQKARMHLLNDGETAIHDALGPDGAPGKWIWAKKKADDDTGGGWEIEANNEPLVINQAKKVTINAGDDGFELNSTGDGVIDMGGKNITIQNADTVKLDNPNSVILGPGGKKVVVDGDPVSTGGHVNATQNVVEA